MLFTATPGCVSQDRAISKTPAFYEKPQLVTPIANTAYQEGRKAFLEGVERSSNPYRENFMKEIDITWTSEDCWDLGWDLEQELHD